MVRARPSHQKNQNNDLFLKEPRLETNETPVRVSLDELISEAEADIADGR